MRCRWDDENVHHIARHGVTPDEALEVLVDEATVHAPSRGRQSAYGTTRDGRPLRVIYDVINAEELRVTTAYQIRRTVLARAREEAER